MDHRNACARTSKRHSPFASSNLVAVTGCLHSRVLLCAIKPAPYPGGSRPWPLRSAGVIFEAYHRVHERAESVQTKRRTEDEQKEPLLGVWLPKLQRGFESSDFSFCHAFNDLCNNESRLSKISVTICWITNNCEITIFMERLNVSEYLTKRDSTFLRQWLKFDFKLTFENQRYQRFLRTSNEFDNKTNKSSIVLFDVR